MTSTHCINSDSSNQARPVTNIYLVDAGIHNCEVDDLGELGSIYDDERVLSMVFATSRAHAKKLFIRFHKSRKSYTRTHLEWTDVISVRLVARDVDIPHGIMQDVDIEVLDHCESRLTAFGRGLWLAHTDARQQADESGVE